MNSQSSNDSEEGNLRTGLHARNSFFPVTHSILSALDLLSDITSNYAIGTPLVCKLWKVGLSDTYVVRTADERYILRVYRVGWRLLSEILYELDLLTHLGHKGLPVSTPIARKDGSFVGLLEAPEGSRYAVLFTYAKGRSPALNETDSYHYGGAVAAIHNATDDFASQHSRFHLDLEHLINTPLKALQPLLAHRVGDWEYLVSLADRLREQIRELPAEELEWGVCHGDVHGANAHIAEDGVVTLFDFDCCGLGWRSYDIAVFHWDMKTNERDTDDKLWTAFLKGYQERRDLKEVDLGAVPLFMAIRQFWLMGLHASGGQDWGFGWINDEYFDGMLKFLRGG